MVRITTRQEGEWQVIGIDGRLAADGVIELEKAVAAARSAVRIDLQALRSADGDGLDAIRRLEARGIPLLGVPPYVRLLLEQTTVAALGADRSR